MFVLAMCLVVHFIADFLLQSREMGKKKSSDIYVLLQHLGIQFGCFLLFLWPVVGIEIAICFSLANAVIHGVIDWNIWKQYKLLVYLQIKQKLNALHKALRAGGTMIDAEAEKAAYDLEVKNFQYWEDHWFYATIGLDQLLHALTLIALVGLML